MRAVPTDSEASQRAASGEGIAGYGDDGVGDGDRDQVSARVEGALANRRRARCHGYRCQAVATVDCIASDVPPVAGGVPKGPVSNRGFLGYIQKGLDVFERILVD